MRFLLSVAVCATISGPVAAADLYFCWSGSNGYTMTGSMTLPDNYSNMDVVTEDDLRRFKISGYHQGQFLGAWDMARRGTSDTWHLRFDPQTMTFLTGDFFTTPHSQGWNANGGVRDCGNPGFGFNSGNHAQDICLNGHYVAESSIAPETPLFASTMPVTATCQATLPMSKN